MVAQLQYMLWPCVSFCPLWAGIASQRLNKSSLFFWHRGYSWLILHCVDVLLLAPCACIADHIEIQHSSCKLDVRYWFFCWL